MEFKKFTSIENTYRKKYIDRFIIPENTTFIAREKLDGANIQLLFTPNEEMRVGKRTSFLEKGEPFFDIWNTLEKYKTELDILQKVSNNHKKVIRIYGELYGPGINGRVDYGPEKKIALFEVSIDNVLFTQHDLNKFFAQINISHLLPDGILISDDINEILDYDVENMPRKGSEGVIIQPLFDNLFDDKGNRFILKKKSKAFEDTRQEAIDKGAGRAEAKGNDLIYNLNQEFKKYVTRNRILDVFAKHGTIKESKQIGDYIKLITEDAKIDFLKDHDINVLLPNIDKKKEKDLYNVGGAVVNLLKEYL